MKRVFPRILSVNYFLNKWKMFKIPAPSSTFLNAFVFIWYAWRRHFLKSHRCNLKHCSMEDRLKNSNRNLNAMCVFRVYMCVKWWVAIANFLRQFEILLLDYEQKLRPKHWKNLTCTRMYSCTMWILTDIF